MHVRFGRKPVSRLSPFRVVALICFVALPSSVLAYQSAAAIQQAGSISGHIFTDTALPVQGTAITLLNSQTTLHKVALSDASGASGGRCSEATENCHLGIFQIRQARIQLRSFMIAFRGLCRSSAHDARLLHGGS